MRAADRDTRHSAVGRVLRRLRVGRSVGVTQEERHRSLPGDDLIPDAVDSMMHGITIQRPSQDVWPWVVQMGAGSRAGWYSYDWIDNGRRPSARLIVPEWQHPVAGTVFPAMPGVTDGFTLLAIEPGRTLTLGWPRPDGRPQVTWTFVLEDTAPGVARLLVRARGGSPYHFLGLPQWLSIPAIRLVHFIMQRRQLLGIAARAEAMPTAVTHLPAAGRSKRQVA